MRRFRFLRNPDPASLGSDLESFLRALGGPACLFLEGADSSRTRAFVTLLHGNEPSGARALLHWLQQGRQSAVNVVCIVASVNAALQPPLYSHRMLPGARDLNRCFRPPFSDEQGHLAEEILEILRLHHPEAVVDMHNTSGSGPAFGVCTHRDRHHDALVSLFTRRLVITDIGLGALMEITEESCPTVTVEVGGRLDREAQLTADAGLVRYFTADNVLTPVANPETLEYFEHSIRLELNPGMALAYADQPVPEADVTLLPDIERHNFQPVDPAVALGWVKGDAKRVFRARDGGGRCAVASLVRVEEGALFPAQRLKLFMVTNNPDIAQSDCICYAVEV
ncbi:succinylglutamate desuccinylase [Parahaliea maris]|uniref:Succinylglutamate desuccinylase n=1 Tax=Parahaliea maris TaxID=2716870 RepID=A0A5C9A749_9GAMM|nr:succinylglutamate desuccinylase/aspartoacylase family protein [Parahaliea maris]TXS95407.1 succinylglutamate desuccinylase [Parahaliea maris]